MKYRTPEVPPHCGEETACDSRRQGIDLGSRSGPAFSGTDQKCLPATLGASAGPCASALEKGKKKYCPYVSLMAERVYICVCVRPGRIVCPMVCVYGEALLFVRSFSSGKLRGIVFLYLHSRGILKEKGTGGGGEGTSPSAEDNWLLLRACLEHWPESRANRPIFVVHDLRQICPRMPVNANMP